MIWKNSYGTGEPFRPIFGPVLTRSEWELIDSDPADEG